jgi:XisH protein
VSCAALSCYSANDLTPEYGRLEEKMPQRDRIHNVVKQALIKDGWNITDDPYVIEYGKRFLYIDLGITQLAASDLIIGRFIGAECGNSKIVIEIVEKGIPESDIVLAFMNETKATVSA